MSKFCTSCGNELSDDAILCEECGENAASEQAALHKPIRIKKFIVISCCVITVILVLTAVIGHLGAYKTPINNFFKAISTEDGELFSESIKTVDSSSNNSYDMSSLKESFPIDKNKYRVEFLHKLELDSEKTEKLGDALEETVDKAYAVKIKIVKTGSNSGGDFMKQTMYVCQIDGHWYTTQPYFLVN